MKLNKKVTAEQEEFLDLEELMKELTLAEEKEEALGRDILLFTEITREVASNVVAFIREVNEVDDLREKENPNYVRQPITLFIDTYGGEVSAGFSMITAIKQSRTKVIGVVTGNCYSMGVPLFVSCHERHTTSFATYMLHSVSVESIEGRSITDYKNKISSVELHQEAMRKFLRNELPDVDPRYFDNILDADKDSFFLADEAVELGIAQYNDYELLKYIPTSELGEKNPKTNRKWKAKGH